jgi:hypothetical protein
LGTETREGVGRGAIEDGGALPLYKVEGEGRQPVVKMEKWPALMEMNQLMFKWCLLSGMKRGGRGNGRGMLYGARGSDSMAGRGRGGTRRWLEPVVEAFPCFGAEGGRRGRVGQKAEHDGRVAGPTGSEVEKNPFRIKIKILKLQRL